MLHRLIGLFPRPRALPVTICALAILLGIKVVSLGRLVLTGEAAAAVISPIPTEALAASPPDAKAAKGAMPGRDLMAPAGTDSASPQGKSGASAGSERGREAGGGPPQPNRASGTNGDPVSASGRPPGDVDTGSDWPLLQDLRDRREALEARSAALDAREAALQAAQADLSARLAGFNKEKAELQGLEAGRQAHEDAGWRSMVKLYEAMKPNEAAQIFDVLDMRVLLPLLDIMNERKAAVVMGEMDPERARLATQLLVEYRAKRDSTRDATTPTLTAAPG